MKSDKRMDVLQGHIMAAMAEVDKIRDKPEPTIPDREYRALIRFIQDNDIPLKSIWEYVHLIADC